MLKLTGWGMREYTLKEYAKLLTRSIWRTMLVCTEQLAPRETTQNNVSCRNDKEVSTAKQTKGAGLSRCIL